MLQDAYYTHETYVVPADFPVLEVGDHRTVVVPSVEQDVVDNNVAAAAASTNAGIEHNSRPLNMGPSPPTKTYGVFVTLYDAALHDHILDEQDDHNIEEVDMSELDPSKIIDVDA